MLRRRMSKRKCRLFKYYDDGEITPLRHPPFYRHQQVIPGHTAAEGEPDGTSAARCGGVGAQQGNVQYNWLSQERQMTVTTAYLEKKIINYQRTSLGLSTTERQVSKFRVCHLSRGPPPSPNFNCPVAVQWLINPNPPNSLCS